LLSRLDGRGYKAYQDLRGTYALTPRLTLAIDHVQGDPFAQPSRVRLLMDRSHAGFSADWCDHPNKVRALCDFLLRAAVARAAAYGRVAPGSGHSGRVLVDQPSAEVLERSGCGLDRQHIELRLRVGLPAFGRRVAADGARRLLLEALPRLAHEVLLAASHDPERVAEHVRVVHDQAILRDDLRRRGLIAFLTDGAVLPRRSGADDRPLPPAQAVPLMAPRSLRVEVELACGRSLAGLGIPEGITVIVGGGFHGKSTLLRALAMGVYDHPPGDGREFCVTRGDAVKIRAEDGRAVRGVDISPFMEPLPGGVATAHFSTANASGSTSQAAAIVEALEVGSRLLLVDEDTSATNFMIRDARMQRLVSGADEPIVPFVDRIRELRDRFGVSVVLVMGGSGDYLDVADHVIHMHDYRPVDVTEKARAVAAGIDSRRLVERDRIGEAWIDRRRHPAAIDFRQGGRERLVARSRSRLQVGQEEIELGAVEQLVDASQTRSIADAIRFWQRAGVEGTLAQQLEVYERCVEEEGLDAVSGWPAPDRARARRYELAAAVNRYRSLRLVSGDGCASGSSASKPS
jgi:predicted ABC-class ATPase